MVLEKRIREASERKDELRSWGRPAVEPTRVPGEGGYSHAMKPKLDSLPPFKGDAELSRDAVLIKKEKKKSLCFNAKKLYKNNSWPD